MLFQVTFHAKMTMPDLQRYHRNLNLIKSVEDNAVFLTRKVFNSNNFSSLSYKQETFAEKHTNEIRHGYLNHT